MKIMDQPPNPKEARQFSTLLHDIDVHGVSKIITDNLKEGYDIYNESFIGIVLQYNTKRKFRVFIGTANKERELITEASVKSEVQYATDYLVIIKGNKGNFIKYKENGGEFKDYPDCKHNDDFINIIIYNINYSRNTRTFPIAIIGSPSSPISQDEELAIVQKKHSPYEKPFFYCIEKHYLTFHKEIGGLKEDLDGCVYKCDSVLEKPFRDLYNEHFSSRDISEKLVSDSEHDNTSKSDNINVDSCLDNSPQNIAEVANVPRNLNVNCGTSDDHQKRQENNFEHYDTNEENTLSSVGSGGSCKQQDSNRKSDSEANDSRSDSIGSQEEKQPALSEEEEESSDELSIHNSSGQNSGNSSEQESNSERRNTDEKSINEDKTSSLGIKRLRVSDGNTQKPPVKKVTLDDSPSDLPGNNNDCGPKGSSSHNSEQALEEDQLLSFGDSNNGTDSHNLAQDFNKDLLLSSGNCDNKSDLYDQAQNFNSDNEGSTLSSPDEKRPCIGDGDTQKLPNVKEMEVELNVGNDESYEQQDSSRKSGSEISGLPSSSSGSQEGEQPTLNDVESNGENQEAFSRSSSTSDENDNNNLSEESGSRSSVDVRDNNDLQDVFLQEGDSYNKLGDNCCSINDIAKGAECYEKAIEYYEKAKALDSQNTSIIKVIGNSYNKLGDSYCSINDKAKGAECYKKTIEYYERVRKLDSRDMFITSIAHVSDKLGDIIEDEKAECYEKAMKYHGMAIDYLGGCSLACDSRSRDWDAIKLFIDKIDNVNKLLNNEGTLLHLAATDGQREMVKYLLEKGANVTFGSKGGSTPLHKAAQKGHLDIVRMLLERNAAVNAVDRCGRTALHLAAQEGYLDIVRMLLERNAAVNAVDRCGRTALHLAAQEGHLDVVEMLLKKGARSFLDQYNNTPLQLVSKRLSQDPENDRLKEVQGFLSNFIENSDESSSVLSSSGSQEVEHTASNDISEKSFGDEKSVCSSPEQNSGSSLEQASSSSNDSDNSAEQESANVGNDESYEQQDSDRESDLEGCTRLHIAEAEGNNEFVKTLLKKGDDVNSKNKHGRTPLHDAALEGHNEVVKTLLERGASIDSKDEDGCTPLHNAALEGHNEVVKTLLERGANVNALNNRKNSPFILAEEKSNHGVIEILKNENARLCRNYCEILEMRPGTNLNDVRSANQMRRRSQSF